MSDGSFTVGSYNILDPFQAVKWRQKEGLNQHGLLVDTQTIKDSILTEWGWKDYSNWEERKETVKASLSTVDICCLQEVSPDTVASLEKITTGSRLAFAAYNDALSEKETYGTAIFCNPNRVKFLNGTALKHRIVRETENWNRAAASALLAVAGKLIKVASVHLSGYNPNEKDPIRRKTSKQEGFDELLGYVEPFETDLEQVNGVVVAGDFNEDPKEEFYDLYRPGFLEKKGYRSDDSRVATEPGRFRKIDWIYYRAIQPEKVDLQPLWCEMSLKQASDHLMTGTKMKYSA